MFYNGPVSYIRDGRCSHMNRNVFLIVCILFLSITLFYNFLLTYQASVWPHWSKEVDTVEIG
jgi:hypothetical protein